MFAQFALHLIDDDSNDKDVVTEGDSISLDTAIEIPKRIDEVEIGVVEEI